MLASSYSSATVYRCQVSGGDLEKNIDLYLQVYELNYYGNLSVRILL